MNHFRIYSYIITVPLLAIALLILSTFLYMDPLIGDLTRIGGFTENNFGWNRKLEVFEEPLFKAAGGVRDYDKYYDVVVLGDSFSMQKQHSWINYFANESGLSTIAFHVDNVSVNKLVNSEIFKRLPPKFLIYESVERSLVARHHNCSDDRNSSRLPARIPMYEFHSLNKSPVLLSRKQLASRKKNTSISSAVNLAKKMAARTISGKNKTAGLVTRLTTSELFTNRSSNILLYLDHDADKINWSSSDKAKVRCFLVSQARAVEANRQTKFIAMIFPDKLSIYGPYIENEELRDLLVIDEINSAYYTQVRLDKIFSRAIGKGTRDVYLPNDTHCSDIGYKLASRALIEMLRSN